MQPRIVGRSRAVNLDFSKIVILSDAAFQRTSYLLNFTLVIKSSITRLNDPRIPFARP